ncbi:hypothetical protein INS49_006740 [Diaporthe citri]|uniref:uncharacterized protein n=1 Tax=Diaporthe citri TaxID=83186 RepID=UPI001C80067C|nr:uncharacterized protein INS49_006740 [Diaporthe citri]KAG6365133.1 hypothetical protein INS49_006740 [Diaporthe citri]
MNIHALNRSRSLRQPTAGLSRALRKDETPNNVVNTTNVAAASTSSAGAARNTAIKEGPASSHCDKQADPSTHEIDFHPLQACDSLGRTVAYHALPALSLASLSLEGDTTDDNVITLPGKDSIAAHNHTHTRKVIRDRAEFCDRPPPTTAAFSWVGSLEFYDDHYSDHCGQEANRPVQHNALSRATSTNAARSVKPTAPGDAPRLKPAFNTLQQHYSPARNLAPKPLTSSYLAPPSPSKLPANIAISSETAKLQTELLQLHLLHRDADAVTSSWHASARQRLGQRFAELARRDDEVSREEAEVEEARNLAALMEWGGGKGLDGKIQVLDTILSGVWSLGEPNGRYTRAVRKFEKWVDQTRRAVEARRLAGGLGALMEDDEVGFVSELDPAWKDEVSSMARKLDSWRRQLGQLESGVIDDDQGGDQKSSSLARLLSGCRSQVHGMLAELDLMEQIERDALMQETAWIRRMNRDDDESDTPRAGAIWRAF